MSAYCVYCCASPLFLSSVLMAHLNKALDVSTLKTYIQEPLFLMELWCKTYHTLRSRMCGPSVMVQSMMVEITSRE